ncbi:MAG: hypothetical protein DRQ51_02970 [Gammaproteobacteria bacterium]|nr:MAG: hypothetical protein DRQ51_02970 [Gammaproteobacteria bacterium]
MNLLNKNHPIAFLMAGLISFYCLSLLSQYSQKIKDKKPQILQLDFVVWTPPVKNKPVVKKPPKTLKKSKTSKKPPKKIKKVNLTKIKKKQISRQKKAQATTPKEMPPKKITKTKNKNTTKKTAINSLPTPVPLFKLTSVPRFISKIIPEYPKQMQTQNKQATVVIEALIDKYGKVRQVKIKKSAGNLFDKAAVDAIKKSKFSPALIKGTAVAVMYRIPVKFKLQ